MTKNFPLLIRAFFISLLALLVGSCASQPPIAYYNLAPLLTEDHRLAAGATHPPLAIGIGPVQFPDTLNRAQIASRIDLQRLKYNDLHRWGGSLANDFADVLMEDIAALLPAQTAVAVFPWGSYFQPTHRLMMSVSRFDGTLADEVVLAARWTITNSTGKETIFASKSTLHVKITGEGYPDLVTAQSQAVADLSKEIAAALIDTHGRSDR